MTAAHRTKDQQIRYWRVMFRLAEEGCWHWRGRAERLERGLRRIHKRAGKGVEEVRREVVKVLEPEGK